MSDVERAAVVELAARVTREDAPGGAIAEAGDAERGVAIGRVTGQLARGRGRPGGERTAEERWRERVAFELYGRGMSPARIADLLVELLGEGAPADPRDALCKLLGVRRESCDWIERVPVRGEALSRQMARADVRRMLAVVSHMREGRQWYARRDQHVAVAASMRDEARAAGEYAAAATFHAQIARIEGFDAPSKTVNLHGHAMFGPGTDTTLPDGPGVVGGVSVDALRKLGKNGRAMLIELLGADVVARAELPARTDDGDDFAEDAEIVDDPPP